jgi:hypothetical protein
MYELLLYFSLGSPKHRGSIGKIKRHFPKIKIHDASCFPY